MAVGNELLYREAEANGYSLSHPDEQKERYIKMFDGGFQSLTEANTSAGDDFAKEYQAVSDRMFESFDRVKEEYGLTSDKELAELTFPIYLKGHTASVYLWKTMSDYYTREMGESLEGIGGELPEGFENSYAITEEMSEKFWQMYYPELLQKYHVEWKE